MLKLDCEKLYLHGYYLRLTRHMQCVVDHNSPDDRAFASTSSSSSWVCNMLPTLLHLVYNQVSLSIC